MKYRFITIVHNFILPKKEITVNLTQGFLSNCSSVLRETFDNDLSAYTIGSHSVDEFEGQTYFYIDGYFADGYTQSVVDDFGTKLTFAFLRVIQDYVERLWYIEDNSVYIRDGFLYTYENRISDGCTFKASLSAIFSKANGIIEPSVFSLESLMPLSSDMFVINPENITPEIDNYKDATLDHFWKKNKVERKLRAWGYILLSRSQSQTPLKMMLYTMALESLLGTSTTELSHRLAERSAIMLGTTLEERTEIYTTIKKSYDNRSSIAHGDLLKEDSNFSERVVKIDRYLRKLMSFEEPYSMENAEIDKFFIDKLLS